MLENGKENEEHHEVNDQDKTYKKESSNRSNGGSFPRENYYKTYKKEGSNRSNGGSFIRENYYKTYKKRSSNRSNGGSFLRENYYKKKEDVGSEDEASNATDLMFTQDGTPIQTLNLMEHSKEDQMAIELGRPVTLCQGRRSV